MSRLRLAPFTIALLSAFMAVPSTTGCAGQSAATVISEIEGGVTDAELAIGTVATVIDGILAAAPNPTVRAEFDTYEAAANDALRALNAALVGATSLADANVQAALASFSDAYAALMAAAGKLGIKPAVAGMHTRAARGPDGVVYVAPPAILHHLAKR